MCIRDSPSVILTIEKQPGANTVTLTDDIEKALAELQSALPSDVQLNTKVFQQKSFIVNAPVSYTHLTLPTSDLV